MLRNEFQARQAVTFFLAVALRSCFLCLALQQTPVLLPGFSRHPTEYWLGGAEQCIFGITNEPVGKIVGTLCYFWILFATKRAAGKYRKWLQTVAKSNIWYSISRGIP